MENKLFIIGNGFDLHHEIASKYSDFASYLESIDPDTFRIMQKYVVPYSDLWSGLEELLAKVDIGQIQNYAQNFLICYGADDWSETGHHDYEYEIEKICVAISDKLLMHFLVGLEIW